MELAERLYGRSPIKRASISFNTAATHQIVAAVPGKRIIVVNYGIKGANNQSITWIRGTSTAMSGAILFSTSDLWQWASDPINGIFATDPAERLAITLSAATLVAGYLSYAEVK